MTSQFLARTREQEVQDLAVTGLIEGWMNLPCAKELTGLDHQALDDLKHRYYGRQLTA